VTSIKLINRALALLPWSIRGHVKHIPGIAQLQRFIVSKALDGKEFAHLVEAGPAKGVTFLVRMPEDKGIWTGTYEHGFAGRLAAAVRPGVVAYDIGSWHGFFAGVMAAQGASIVHVFEPLPANADRIRKLVELNPQKRIVLHACAVGDRDTHMDLMVMPETSMAKLEQSRFQPEATSATRVRVAVRTSTAWWRRASRAAASRQDRRRGRRGDGARRRARDARAASPADLRRDPFAGAAGAVLVAPSRPGIRDRAARRGSQAARARGVFQIHAAAAEPRSRTCVIVSPYFPPSMLAGVHRARHLAKHLPSAGWKPIVCASTRLTTRSASIPRSRASCPRRPRSSRSARCRLASPAARRGRDQPARHCSLRRRLFELLATRPIGAVLITGSPYYPMLLSATIRRRFGVPVVLDFQDPWVSAWGETQARWSKSGLSHRLAAALEPRALRGASFVTSISDAQNDQLAARYPWLDRERMAAIPIGSDRDDFDALANGGADTYALEPGCIHLSYVGTVWPR
jgi:FkbM family methyltransferase